MDNKNFYVHECMGSETPYVVLASEKVCKILGREIMAYCISRNQADWLCGVLECYYITCCGIGKGLYHYFKHD